MYISASSSLDRYPLACDLLTYGSLSECTIVAVAKKGALLKILLFALDAIICVVIIHCVYIENYLYTLAVWINLKFHQTSIENTRSYSSYYGTIWVYVRANRQRNDFTFTFVGCILIPVTYCHVMVCAWHRWYIHGNDLHFSIFNGVPSSFWYTPLT